jgi:hypothetical protein
VSTFVSYSNYPHLSLSGEFCVAAMEPYSIIHGFSGSSPELSQKRTSSPGAPAPHAKRAKMEPGQGYSKKDKRRRRKKQPITGHSGTTSGLMQDVRSSSLSPEPPLPSASCSAMGRSPPMIVTSSSKAGHIPIRNEHVVEASHTESKVRLSSLFIDSL